MELTGRHCQVLMDAARAAIRHALGGGPPPPRPEGDIDPSLLQPAGCFVSLHEQRNHRLRGCIGRLDNASPLLPLVLEMAAAVLEDPRFADYRLKLQDLAGISIEISVLSPMTLVADPLDFDLANDGLYLVFGERSGCFLPQVARETGWSKEQLLDRLCTEKMGLSRFIWKNPHARLYTFRARIIGPEAF